MDTNSIFDQALPVLTQCGLENQLKICRKQAEKQGGQIPQELLNAIQRLMSETTDKNIKDFYNTASSVHHSPL
jgi:lipopolysaccharide biosynthesis regulator YciM